MDTNQKLRASVIEARTPRPFIVPSNHIDFVIELCKREGLLDLVKELENFKQRR